MFEAMETKGKGKFGASLHEPRNVFNYGVAWSRIPYQIIVKCAINLCQSRVSCSERHSKIIRIIAAQFELLQYKPNHKRPLHNYIWGQHLQTPDRPDHTEPVASIQNPHCGTKGPSIISLQTCAPPVLVNFTRPPLIQQLFENQGHHKYGCWT